ncbi:hypothetical protein FF1_035554 [Malus domestica]
MSKTGVFPSMFFISSSPMDGLFMLPSTSRSSHENFWRNLSVSQTGSHFSKKTANSNVDILKISLGIA